MIEIYTDGSCRNNGAESNCGGHGVCVIRHNNDSDAGGRIVLLKMGKSICTTNNREELKAIIAALQLTQTGYKNEKCIIKSDSAYCVNMIND